MVALAKNRAQALPWAAQVSHLFLDSC